MLEKTLVPHKFCFDILIYPPNNSCQSYKEIITLVLFSSSALVLTKTHTIVNVSLENENSIMWWGCFSWWTCRPNPSSSQKWGGGIAKSIWNLFQISQYMYVLVAESLSCLYGEKNRLTSLENVFSIVIMYICYGTDHLLCDLFNSIYLIYIANRL